jgi:hypothetical protein
MTTMPVSSYVIGYWARHFGPTRVEAMAEPAFHDLPLWARFEQEQFQEGWDDREAELYRERVQGLVDKLAELKANEE